MRVSFIISSLSSGGAERVMSLMANYWVGKGKQVSIITLATEESDFYLLDKRIKRSVLDSQNNSKNVFSALLNNCRRLILLRKKIIESKPDVVISFIDTINISTLLAMKGSGIPVIISERIDPRFHSIGRMWGGLRYLTYRHASALIVQTQTVASWCKKKWPSLQVDIINNPVVVGVDESEEKTKDLPPGKWIIAVGRLTRQKGFDLLLDAFSRLEPDHGYKLAILGEGEEWAKLEDLIKRYHLVDRVWMPGRVKKPAQYIKKAKIFVLSSRYEGFPNVLLEAMSCGIPVVSFDCPSGPSDIIEHEVNGLLVLPENSEKLAETIQELLIDEGKRKKIAMRSRAVIEEYAIDKIMPKWEAVIHDVVSSK